MRLIIIDGLDAAGKDTHAALVKERYEAKGERVLVRSHPECDNVCGVKAKEALLGHGKWCKIRASMYYALDVLRSVRKYYGRDEVDTLIMVRYLMGTAYLPLWLARVAYRFFKGLVPTSDYMFFLDVDPRQSLLRIETERSKVEMFETLDELEKVRQKALCLVGDEWFVIDTSQSIEGAAGDMAAVLDMLDAGKS